MFARVRNEGKLLFFGVNPSNSLIRISPYDVYRKDLQIYGSFALRYTFHDAFALLESGAVDVAPLLSEQLPIERFPEALRLAGSGSSLKCRSSRRSALDASSGRDHGAAPPQRSSRSRASL
jgi:threonine dehydrogenase-like Zn-dependent dehydrogenase